MAYLSNEAQSAAPTSNTINGVISEFDRSLERTGKLLASLRHIGDHVDGAKPQQATAEVSKLDTPPHSLIDNLHRKERALSGLLSQCEDAVQRLSQSIGI